MADSDPRGPAAPRDAVGAGGDAALLRRLRKHELVGYSHTLRAFVGQGLALDASRRRMLDDLREMLFVSERRHHAELAAAQADVTLHRTAERGVSQQRGTMADGGVPSEGASENDPSDTGDEAPLRRRAKGAAPPRKRQRPVGGPAEPRAPTEGIELVETSGAFSTANVFQTPADSTQAAPTSSVDFTVDSMDGLRAIEGWLEAVHPLRSPADRTELAIRLQEVERLLQLLGDFSAVSEASATSDAPVLNDLQPKREPSAGPEVPTKTELAAESSAGVHDPAVPSAEQISSQEAQLLAMKQTQARMESIQAAINDLQLKLTNTVDPSKRAKLQKQLNTQCAELNNVLSAVITGTVDDNDDEDEEEEEPPERGGGTREDSPKRPAPAPVAPVSELNDLPPSTEDDALQSFLQPTTPGAGSGSDGEEDSTLDALLSAAVPSLEAAPVPDEAPAAAVATWPATNTGMDVDSPLSPQADHDESHESDDGEPT